MLLSHSSMAAVQALARSRAVPLVATVPSFARSFSSSLPVAARLPSTFFHPAKSPILSSLQVRSNSSQAGGSGTPPVAPAPGDAAAAPARKHKWSYARYGFPGPKFSAKHPWVATILRLVVSLVSGAAAIVLIVLIHDMCTYQKRHVDRVPCNTLALHPRRGGPKNLPIIDMLLDDEESDVKAAMVGKPRLLIIGGGWGVSRIAQQVLTPGGIVPQAPAASGLQRLSHLAYQLLLLYSPAALSLCRHG